MKSSMKFFAVMALMLCFAAVSYAQPRAIGGRLGYGIEFSYEHGLGDSNMLSIDAGVPGLFLDHTFGGEAAVTYDWINPFGADFSSVWDNKGEWNWYLGVGAGTGFFTKHNYAANTYAGWNDQIYVGVAGRVGVEYNFEFPLQLSIDWRPIIGPEFNMYRGEDGKYGVVNTNGDKVAVDYHLNGLYYGSIALGVRYRF